MVFGRRSRDHAGQVPAVLRTSSIGVDGPHSAEHRPEVLLVLFIDQVVDLLVVGPWQFLMVTFEIRQLQFIDTVVHVPVLC